METAKLFANGRSQAVRLPKSCRFDGDEVFVKRIGQAVVLMPARHTWQTLVDSLDMFEPGLRLERNQPTLPQTRRPILP
jgi:antitoxin VapB